MGKLKQHLPLGISPDTDLFLAMFLICLPPSMREAVGAGNHKTAAAMVKAVDALWDARGGNDLMVTAATTQQNRSPDPSSGKQSNKRKSIACFKSRPLPALIFLLFKTLAMACVNFTITMLTRLKGVFHTVLGRKSELSLNPFQFGTHSSTRHFPGNAFPS